MESKQKEILKQFFISKRVQSNIVMVFSMVFECIYSRKTSYAAGSKVWATRVISALGTEVSGWCTGEADFEAGIW